MDKISIHLVCKSFASPVSECKEACDLTIQTMTEKCTGYSSCIDVQVYKPKQCFRMLGSCKFNELCHDDVDVCAEKGNGPDERYNL